MSSEQFRTGKAAQILVSECAGDLVVRPWMELDVRAEGDYEAAEVKGQLAFRAKGDLVLNVPEDSSLFVNSVAGDVVIRSITGVVTIEAAAGDVVLSNINSAKIGRIGGDCVASNLSGPLSIERTGGDIVVRNLDGDLVLGAVNGDSAVRFVSGNVFLEKTAGDIGLRSVSGNVEIKQGNRDANLRNIGGQILVSGIDGDVRLVGGLGPFDHSLTANGDIVVAWPFDAPLLLEAHAASIRNRLPLQDVSESNGDLSGRIGDGKTRLSVLASGTLVLKEIDMVSKKWRADGEVFDFDFVSELGDLGAKLSSEIGDHVARVTAELESNFGADFMQRMADQFSQKAGAAAASARKASENWAESAAQKSKPQPSKKASSRGTTESVPGSKQEAQLKILKMVEKGTISPDEAAMLLEALDGD